jgi:hypothetical protein
MAVCYAGTPLTVVDRARTVRRAFSSLIGGRGDAGDDGWWSWPTIGWAGKANMRFANGFR